MNILEELPPIYYLNAEFRQDRNDYMESQFKYWGIKNYHRSLITKYLAKNYDIWKEEVFEDRIVDSIYCMSAHINHVKTMIDWYEREESETCIIVEDDISFENIKYWNFDWKYFEKNLPENWECIQLYFCRSDFINLFLHKRLYNSSSVACYMVNRPFVEKIKKMMMIDGKYKLTLNNNSYEQKYDPKVVDGNLLDVGVTYSIPLFNINLFLDGNNPVNNFRANIIDVHSSKIIKKWWKYEHHKFPIEDFFTYGKPNDFKMTRMINFKGEMEYN